MSKINLNPGDNIVTKNSTGDKGIPVDARTQVQYYSDIQNIEYPYKFLQVIVTDDDPNDLQHPKGIYVVTTLTELGDVDTTGIKTLKEFQQITKNDVGLNNVENVKQYSYNDGKALEDLLPSGVSSSDKLVKESQISDKLEKSGTVYQNHIAKFNSAGNVVDSGFVIPDTENTEQILEYDNKVSGKLKWSNKPTNGTNGQDGKSAYEVWLDENGYTSQDHSEQEFLAYLRATIGSFKSVSYDNDAYNDTCGSGSTPIIGTPITSNSGALDGVSPSSSTVDKIYLMPNDASSPTESMVFITEEDDSTVTPTYSFVYVGNLALNGIFKTEENLGDVEIVDNLNSIAAHNVLSAKQGKVLNEKIGTRLEIDDTIALTWTNGYYNYSDNSIKSSDSQKTATIDLTDYDNNCFIRFMGMLSTVSGGSAGWAFRDSSHNRIQGAYGGWDYDTSLESPTLKEYVMQIPQGAVEFIFSIRFASVSLDDVFFKVQKIYNGSLVDLINTLDGRVNDVESIQSKSSEEYDTGSITSDYLVRDKNGNSWYIRKYIDEDEVDIKIELDPTDDITLGIQEVLSNGTTNELVSSKSIDLHWTKTNGSYLVLRFTKPSNNEITVGQVGDAIDSWNVTYKTNTARLKAKNDEVEMPLYGFVSYERSISSNSYFGVLSDIFYTPEQYNLGGFRIIMPDYITLNWTSGDNHTVNMKLLEHGENTAYKNGDVVKFIRRYSYDLMYRFWFYINSPTRHLSLDYVKYLINSGRIKIFYTPNDKHKSITQRQSSCEQYVRALQRRIVTAADITNNSNVIPKIYSTHDLPMFVHCSDIHSDITRLISAMEYARYIQSDAVILTGDYTMRDFNNGAHYLKDIDEKFNPDSVDGGVLSQRIPILVGTGNHDTGGSGITHAITRSQLIDPFANKYNYMLSANEYLGKDPNNDNAVRDAEVAYYYVDLDIPAPRNGGYVADSQTYNNTQKVRIIMLDIVDGLNNDMSQWAITKAQIDWFINTLNSTPSGVPIFVGMHNGPDKVVAPSVRAAAYEAGGTKRLPYVSDMFTYKAYVDNVYKGLNDTGTYDFNGSPIRQIIDAFISRSQGSGSYSYTGSGTISWSCNFENAEGIFVAYLSGHAHVDYVGYVKDAEQTQLVLGTTCTVCEYGPAGNERGSSNSDCVRGSSGSTQDGFNVYVLDMEHKRVGIARVGANMTVDLEPRTACWISFADETIS